MYMVLSVPLVQRLLLLPGSIRWRSWNLGINEGKRWPTKPSSVGRRRCCRNFTRPHLLLDNLLGIHIRTPWKVLRPRFMPFPQVFFIQHCRWHVSLTVCAVGDSLRGACRVVVAVHLVRVDFRIVFVVLMLRSQHVQPLHRV